MTLRAWIITMRGRIREALVPELQVLRDQHATLLENASIEVRRLRAEALKLEAERDEARCPLTDEEIDELPWCPSFENPMTLAEGLRHFARAIERAHKIGGNDE